MGLFYLSGSYTQLHYNTSSYTIEYVILPNIWVEFQGKVEEDEDGTT